MNKLYVGWIAFFGITLTLVLTLEVTEDQYPAYTSMVSKGIAKASISKKKSKSNASHSLDLSKYRPKFQF